jgi:hypothetical protein
LRPWRPLHAEDYPIPSIHQSLIIDDATNGSLQALVPPDLPSTSFLFSLEDPGAVVFTLFSAPSFFTLRLFDVYGH